MPKKKKPEPIVVPLRDRIPWWINIIGSIILLITLLPMLPWRRADMDVNFGSRFTQARAYSLLSAGDKFGAWQPWLKNAKEMCKLVKEYNAPSPLNSVLGAVASGFQQATDSSVGGASLGCAAWAACTDHVAARCNVYYQMFYTGLSVTILIIFAVLCGFSHAIYMSVEGGFGDSGKGKKKKKKKSKKQDEELENAKWWTMWSAILAQLFVFIAIVTFQAATHNHFMTLQHTGYYPFPRAHAGIYLVWIVFSFQCIAVYCAVTRLYPNPLFQRSPEEAAAEGDGEEEDEYAQAGHNAIYGGDPQMAGAALLGPQGGMGQMGFGGGVGMQPQPMGGMGGGMPPFPPM